MKAIINTPNYYGRRKHNSERGAALVAKMRTGSQTRLINIDDVWGYTNTVGAKRAYNICEVFGRLSQHEDASCIYEALRAQRGRPLRVASIGGGPGTCLLGYAIHERLHASRERPTAHAKPTSDGPRLYVFDYASKWEPLVERVGAALCEAVSFGL